MPSDAHVLGTSSYNSFFAYSFVVREKGDYFRLSFGSNLDFSSENPTWVQVTSVYLWHFVFQNCFQNLCLLTIDRRPRYLSVPWDHASDDELRLSFITSTTVFAPCVYKRSTESLLSSLPSWTEFSICLGRKVGLILSACRATLKKSRLFRKPI